MNEASFLISLLKEFGPLVCLVAYYLWRDRHRDAVSEAREAKLALRVEFLQDTQWKEVTDLIRASTAALANNTSAFLQVNASLNKRPCLMHGSGDFNDGAT